jgi:hypothetical protein
VEKKNQRHPRAKQYHGGNGLIDMYRIFHPVAADYTFFSVAHGTFSKIDHMLGHKANLNKYQKIEIIHCLLTDHSRIKLDISSKENHKNVETHSTLNNTVLNAIEEVTKFIQMKLRHNLSEPVAHSKGNVKREIYRHEHLHQKIRDLR